jgi:hypothetical protein
MDCKTARLLLELHRPQPAEIDPTESAALEGHLLACPECAAAAQVERQADLRITRAMRAVPVPTGLRERLQERLAVERRRAFRQKAVTAGRWSAVAAVVLLALGGLSWWLVNRHPALDLVALRDAEIEKMASPRKEWVEVMVAAEAPPRFDYNFLVHYDFATCQGQRVSYLVFVRGQTRAAVYVVNARQFDLAKLPEDTDPLETQGFRVVVWRDAAENPDTAFVIIFTGDLGSLLNAHAG